MATSPSLCAGKVAKAPLKDPTGVRAADTITTSSMGNLPLAEKWLWRRAQNAANAGTGKLRRKHPTTTMAYWGTDELSSVAVAKWRWTCALRGDVLKARHARLG